MSPTTQKPSGKGELNLVFFSIPQSFVLQAGTASMLLLLLAQKASLESLQAMGQASEELFRGDRLPILNFPNDT